jgi:Kef-type K+ transport system membrane component KefB/mannitol/fructose-specific phosphotransferase system IIA component (Ntr-type)
MFIKNINKRVYIKCFVYILFIFFSTSLLFSSNSEISINEKMTQIVFQIGIIIFSAWLGGFVFQKIKMPSVLGEILAGMIIGPYCLGKISFFCFPEGIFPLYSQNFSVSPELYSYSTIAAIVLLFCSGLETDLKTFLKYSASASIIGIFEVIFSFILGDIFGIIFSKYLLNLQSGFMSTVHLFFGLVGVATSVGIGARILSDKKKMDSPEGVTILATALFDDVLGIIFLAIVIGIVKSGHIAWVTICFIGLKSLLIWLSFTILGLIFAHNISRFLKFFNDRSTITVISLGLALIIAGIFEKSGLTMIIGSYIMGLSLSKTDVSIIIKEHISPIQKMFVPVFFCVIGMLFDISQFAQIKILLFGLFYFLFIVFGKIFGSAIPSLFLNFNLRGALRIGVGMIPHGEVSLIILGIGLSAGLISKEFFSVSIIMTFLTILVTPIILEKLLSDKSGVRKEGEIVDLSRDEIFYKIPNAETLDLVLFKILNLFEKEDFFIATLDKEDNIYQIRKDNKVISLKVIEDNVLVFECKETDKTLVNTFFYEVVNELDYFIQNLKTVQCKEKIVDNIFDNKDAEKQINFIVNNIKKYLNKSLVSIYISGKNKEEILGELLDIAISAKYIDKEHKQSALNELIEREKIISTGIQKGFAFPHIRTNVVKKLLVVVGINKKGVDFESLDNELSKIFIMILAPKDDHSDYLNFMAEMIKFLKHIDIEDLLNSQSNDDLYKKLINPKI